MNNFFDQSINRLNTRAVKWDLVEALYGNKDVLPMWVADMDFQIPSAVTDALVKRAQHGVFGYTFTDKKLDDTIKSWLTRRHNWDISSAWLLYSPGVIASLHMAIQALTKEEDKVLIQTPVYPPFYSIVEKHNRTIVKNELKFENGKYQIDFEDFEAKLKQGVKAFVLCSPHNPIGRVWTAEELEKMGDLCEKYDVLIFSDEIHADLVYKPHVHVPISTINDQIKSRTITFMSPTKTFNLAGLQVSYVVAPNKNLREALKEMFETQGMHMLNTMGVTALEAAYTNGDIWLDQLIDKVHENINLVIDAFSQREDVTVIRPEGTYLIWMDFRNLNLTHSELKKFLQESAKVGLNDGESFGESGSGFMRINVACPTIVVEEGIKRIITALDTQLHDK
ncbi:MalY/PatB family protein [Saliterribacillus persicus]|uniref:cysteine-S-conjugate beta-lyase n=1 Tax=Saliterribacillus persicus TaxID=930114 RepID=A0A368XG10_9BACI|nr:PatB family C-S lyase [Saliterribacillus persicus]RCW66931.1 cystathionine beta-lyase [Saliterribacillus persicus]